jgi:predicted SAM-dependent methyltransferase
LSVLRSEDSNRKLLNVGCGHCYHSEWTNIDLVACGPDVRRHDLRRGLPYEDSSFDAVYHSHVLEHLAPEEATSMLGHCYRVLRAGGVLRVVVPDLEGIARTYLKTLESALGDEDEWAVANHQWMTLELLDQMTRRRRGGRMGMVMRQPDLPNQDFVRQRMGAEMDGPMVKHRRTMMMRLGRALRGARKHLALAAVSMIEGAEGRAAYREGRFRNSGEIHRWMYDRVSLARLLREVGFEEPMVCAADESRIPNFDSFQLDRVDGFARKPDSLYVEAIKPSASRLLESDLTLSTSSSAA